MTKQEDNKKIWIDHAKGVSILLIVLAHIADGYIRFVSHEQWVATFMKSAYIVALHSFFFLAGLFAVKLHDRNFIDVFKSKFRLIFIPFIIWTVILGISKVIFSNHTMVPMKWIDLFYALVKPVSITWFLYVLFWSYIIYKLLSVKLNIIIILLVSVVLFYLRQFNDIFIINRFFSYFAYFVSGALLSKFILMDTTHKYFNIWIAMSIMFILHCCINVHFANNLIAICGIYLVIAISIAIEKIKALQIIGYIGSISLVIYLFHIMPLTLLRAVMLNYFHITNPYLYMIVQFILTISICLLLNELLLKYKVRRYLFER